MPQKRLIRRLTSAMTMTCLLLAHGGVAMAADLTVAAWGGLWEQSLRKCVVEPFEKKTGKKVDIVLGTVTQWLNQIQANPSHPPIDIIYNTSDGSFDAIGHGLVDRFTLKNVPNMAKLTPDFANIGGGYGTAHNYGGMGILYDSKTVKDPPKSWKEFVDGTIAGKWKAMMPNLNQGTTVNMWQFAKLYGGGIDNVQPGLDRIKAMLESGNLSFWSEPNQVLNALKSGDVDLAMYWDGRSWAFIADGNSDYKYITPAPGVVVAVTWIQKVKGSPDIGWDYVNMSLSTEAQTCFGTAMRYGVANAQVKFTPQIQALITPADKLILPPFKELPAKQSQWVEMWNKQIGR
ncbi:MAG TPA: extracellular solute-binding protein [Rhodopila sp.]|uniref:extracellular solute-binding protein n=1 Tax=Rhodopila sp. TaxID=2480087 RepID=UPI002C5EF3ED|nr:extracellular solute-binding protein [Rhodopila sp.]HVY16734.1 extracellular solute-binding protein [Rhodopila sp.]